jgi:hypothetical protein
VTVPIANPGFYAAGYNPLIADNFFIRVYPRSSAFQTRPPYRKLGHRFTKIKI